MTSPVTEEKVTYTITVRKDIFPFAPGSEVVLCNYSGETWKLGVYLHTDEIGMHKIMIDDCSGYCYECHPISTHGHLLGTAYPADTPACLCCKKAVHGCTCDTFTTTTDGVRLRKNGEKAYHPDGRVFVVRLKPDINGEPRAFLLHDPDGERECYSGECYSTPELAFINRTPACVKCGKAQPDCLCKTVSKVTDTELSAIRSRCEAATPGPWHVVTDEDRNDSAYAVCAATPMFIPFSGINRKHDSSFIAAANPETVLRLVKTIRKQASDIEELSLMIKVRDDCIMQANKMVEEFEKRLESEIVCSVRKLVTCEHDQPALEMLELDNDRLKSEKKELLSALLDVYSGADGVTMLYYAEEALVKYGVVGK